MKRRPLTRLAVATAVATGLALSGCGDAGSPSSGGSKESINVLAAKFSHTEDLRKLTKKHFTAETGITVNYTVLPENEARSRMDQEFASRAGRFDVASVGAYEVPIYSKNRWLAPLDSYAKADNSFDQGDIFPNMTASVTGADGRIYAEPFNGESSFLMYRKDLFRQAGLAVPQNPTWDQVASLAAEIDGTGGAAGICLRGLPGWGQNLAPLNSVIHTFGGGWYDMDWNAQLTSPAFKKAVQFYVDLLREHGQAGAAQSGSLETAAAFQQGKCAMLYDATAFASTVEADGSTVKGKVGYAPAPHAETQKGGWLWTWAWGVDSASKKKDAAWEFISWASSKQYQELVGATLGWGAAPAGTRQSLYADPEYRKAAAAWYQQEYTAVQNSADPKNQSVGPLPYTGIQFVGIPEFADLGTKVSQEISLAIDGRQSVDTALQKSQEFAQAATAKYRTG